MKKRTLKYNSFQTLIFSQSITPIIVVAMDKLHGRKEPASLLSFIIGEGFFLLLFFLINSHAYKLEKIDEMVQYNLAKANKITLYLMCAVLLISALIDECFIHDFISPTLCWLTATSAIALRSLLYIFFDSPSQKEMEE